jgi:hypothetical protein
VATVSCDGAASTSSNCGQTLEVWIKALQARLGGATYALIKCELQVAIREFYMRSLGWRDTIGPFQIDAGMEFVYLNPVDQYAHVQHVLAAYIQVDALGKKFLVPRTRAPELVQGAEPNEYFCAEPYTLQLSPITPTAMGRVLYVVAALVPAPNAERLPQISVTHHYEGILNGALMRLYGMQHKPWTNMELAMDSRRAFRREISSARDMANRGHTMTDTPFRFPPF